MIVSADELVRFERAAQVIGNLAGLFKAAIASAFTVCACVIGIAMWINDTTAKAHETQQQLHDLTAQYLDKEKELSKWRSVKDDIDARLTAIAESQQRQLDRQYSR